MAMQPTLEEQAEVDKIASRLRDIRKRRGISQREIAAEMGVTQSYYSLLENGHYDPKTITLQVWARALGYRVKFSLETL